MIANEKQRKTLHYLLSSRLTSGEIVLGKLLARMLHVAVFLAIGLPIMSLLTLFGGVDPLWVVMSTAGTVSTSLLPGRGVGAVLDGVQAGSARRSASPMPWRGSG